MKAIFRIVKNGKIGYINEKGDIIIEPEFEKATPFKDGVAEVSVKQEETEISFKIDEYGNRITERSA